MGVLQDSYANLNTLYTFSRRISLLDSAKRARTQRTMALEKMLEKILLHDHCILVLLQPAPQQPAQLDVSMIASAARNIMETANLYFHIAQRGLCADDLAFRGGNTGAEQGLQRDGNHQKTRFFAALHARSLKHLVLQQRAAAI